MGAKNCGSPSYLWRFLHFTTILWSPRHWIWVTRNVNWCIWTSTRQEKSSKDIWDNNTHIPQYGGNILWQLFIFIEQYPFFYNCFDNQDTESESCEIEIGVAGPIFTPKNIMGSIVKWYTYFPRWEKNIVEILHIYGDRPILLLFCKSESY